MAAIVIAWWGTAEGLLLLLAAVGGIQAVGTSQPGKGDSRCCVEFILLVVTLAALATIGVPGPGA